MIQSLAPPDIRLLFEGAKMQSVAKGEVIHTSEETGKLMLVNAGYIKRYFIAHEGSIGVQTIFGPDDIFPMTVVFKQLFNLDIYRGPEVYYYKAMTNLTLCIMNVDNLLQRVETHPLLYSVLLQNAGIRLRSNIQFLENLRLHGAYGKTAHQLAYLAGQFGKEIEDGIKIQIPLIHQDLADIIGTTRETVTASIIKLRDKKLIRTNRQIVVLDYDKLVREAYA